MPRRCGGWPRETVLPHSEKPTPPRFARLPLPEEGARNLCHSRSGTHVSPTCAALFRFPHLSFMPPAPYPPLRGTFPSRGRLTIRESPLLKKVAHHPCEPIRSPSTVIPSAAEGSLLHCRHRHTCALTQTTPWCFLFRLSLAHDLPLCKKDPSTSVGMTGGRRVISHSLSHRFVNPSCAFGAPLL